MSSLPKAVVGWRVWRVDPASGKLRSVVADNSWGPGVNESICLGGATGLTVSATTTERCPQPPGAGCTCGFYGLWDLGLLLTRERWTDIYAGQKTTHRAFGLISGSGVVALHGSEGFRSQRARIVALFTNQPWERDLDSLLERSSRWGSLSFGFGQRLRARRLSLSATAELYGVPLLTLSEALALGVLLELGLAEDQDRKLRNMLRSHGSRR
jgi:hypothetical protein